MFSVMADYKKFYIQQQTFDGTTYSNVGSRIDTYATFGVVCQECPFKFLPESKDLPKRDWHDEHGDDVFVPADGLRMKAYDMEVEFLYVGNVADIATQVKAFISFIYGRNTGGSPLLEIYDEYTQTGRRNVVVQSVPNELYFYDDVEIDAIAQFKVKFKVNDPVYEVSIPSSSSSS